MYDPSLGDPELFLGQVHDFNPGITNTGVFWTTIVSARSVQVDLDAGTATLEVNDIQQKDYFDFENAILGNGATPRQGRVSFKVTWTAIEDSQHFDNPAQQYRADMRYADAKMEWSGRSGDYEFQSAPLATSTAIVAQFGKEWNGSFY